MIEVYAYWNQLSDGTCTRNSTIIVSGKSNSIIGNVILKNPGSSRPINTIPNALFANRMQFRPDATMYAIADLFELDKRPGIVQLFNLFDFVHTDPTMATVIVLPTQDDILQNISDNKLPTYLGWGNEWTWPVTKDLCQDIFNEILPRSPYLLPEMENNPFTHPLYLMRYGKNRSLCRHLLLSFRSLL